MVDTDTLEMKPEAQSPSFSLSLEARPRRIASDVTFTNETITPDMARSLLADTKRRPRIDKRVVDSYAAAMKAGGWIENGQSIAITRSGEVVDGIHRLLAIIEADVPIRTAVARGASLDMMHVMDQHRQRTFTGTLEARGIPNASDIHRSLSKLIRIHNGVLFKSELYFNWARLDLVLSSNPEILEASKISYKSDVRIPMQCRTPLIFMALRAGLETEILTFLRLMNDASVPVRHPAKQLHTNLDSLLSNAKNLKVDQDVFLAMSILAFNDFLAGKEAQSAYSWRPNYGSKVKLKASGKPVSMKEVRKESPPNCDFPIVTGYPGLEDGDVEDPRDEARMFRGLTAEGLMNIKKGSNELRIEMAVVSPEFAFTILKNFNNVNRKIQKTHVDRIKRDILKGNWMVNVQAICFSGNPFDPDDATVRLLNGQHRLQACALSGVPIEVPIAINVPEEAFATFDKSAKRTKTESSGDARVIRSAAVLQWRQDNHEDLERGDRPTASEIIQTLKDHPRLVEFARRIRTTEGMSRADEYAKGSVMTYFLNRIHLENPVLAAEFFDKMRSGSNLDRGDPIIDMRAEAMAHRKGSNSYGRYASLEMLLRYWGGYKAWKKKLEKKQEQPRLLLN